MEVIGIVNFKGGTGKTTTAVNLAIGLAQQGKKVLAIDLDPQGSLTLSLGFTDPEQLEVTVGDKLLYANEFQEYDPLEGILHHHEGIDLLPANIELAKLEVTLMSADSREYALAMYLETLEDVYDIVVLDCSPALSIITTNALTCANQLIIPLQAHFLAVKGMEQLMESIQKVKKRLNRSLVISGILVTMVNHQTKYSKEMIPLIQEQYGNSIRVYGTVIPFSTRAIETSSKGTSIYRYDPTGKVATAYENFLKEFTENQ